MKRRSLGAAALALAGSWLLFAQAPQPATHQVKLNGHVFTLPAGFDIELVAGPPLVNRPITADFDEDGRLYVADSSGSNDRVKVQMQTKTHRIVRLEDTKGVGTFDRATVFADKMMFPEGTMWLDGSLYVAAVPVIWKLTDTDGDGVADQRAVWFDGKTATGCANDLHGPYRGPDGWIYWCKGAFEPQVYDRPGQQPFKTRAAHVFRARPDGTGVEPVMTGGMDNPVDLVFTPGGERIFTTTFFQFPGNGQRDGLVHAVYGGIYGKDWAVIHEPAHKWTGPAVMPVLTHLGPAAPAGLHRYESDAFGKEYKDSLFAALFNLQKVTRHVLEPHGATFKTRDSDFVVSDNKDFHPTDVIEDADGSLLIVDTGGWYKLCCPTSQLVKPDVLGAIYRVRRAGAKHIDDPRGRKVDWTKGSHAAIAGLLGDPRPAVRRRAIETLARRGATALEALDDALRSQHVEARRNAVWCATRIDHPEARKLVRRALGDTDETLRHAALHSSAVRRDREALSHAVSYLQSGLPQLRRTAAEAVGRIGDKAAADALLQVAGMSADRFVEHALIYALIELGNVEAATKALGDNNARIRRAALIALDQMQGGRLTAQAVMRELAADDAGLREAAWWIASHHPEWGADLSRALDNRLRQDKITASEREELVQQLARLAKSPAIQTLLAGCSADSAAPLTARQAALAAMARAELKETPAEWLTALTLNLQTAKNAVLAESVATVRSLRLPKQPPATLGAILVELGADAKVKPAVRLAALATVPGGLAKVEPAVFDFLLARLDSERPVVERTLAADALSRARLSATQLVRLTQALKTAGPMELPRLVEAFSRSNDIQVGQAFVAAISAAPARTGLRVETLKPVLTRYGPGVLKHADGLLASLQPDLAKQQAHLEAIAAKLPAGDVRHGQAVFNGTKAACATCHTIGYLGGKIGPDLTRIGSIRTERDLLESILFPSASFVRGYESVLITTRGGKLVTGLPRRDAPDEVVLVIGANQEVRIPRDEIEELQPGRVSVMPAGLDQQLTLQQLADLMAFLKACR